MRLSRAEMIRIMIEDEDRERLAIAKYKMGYGENTKRNKGKVKK